MKAFVYSALTAALLLSVSCQKEAASSKIDPNAKDVPYSSAETTGLDGVQMGNAPAESVQRQVPADGKYPAMTFKNDTHDFGSINNKDRVSHVFEFTNTGEADLIISNAVGSCGCTVPEYPKSPVKPGESGTVKVTFNPGGKSGMQSKTVTLTTNTEKGEEKLTVKSVIE